MIPLFKVYMSDAVPDASKKVLISGNVTEGQVVDKFERALTKYINNENILTLNSATSGLTLGLRLLLKDIPEMNWNGFNINTDYHCILDIASSIMSSAS